MAHPPVCDSSLQAHTADISFPLPAFNTLRPEIDNGVNTSPMYHSFQVEPLGTATNTIAGPGPQTVHHRLQQQHHHLDVETPSSPRQLCSAPRPRPTRRQQPSSPNPQIRPSSSFMNNLYSFDDSAPETFDGGQAGNRDS